MSHGQSETIDSDDARNAQTKSLPTLGVIALRFITLLVAIVSVFAWAWSR